VSKIGTDASLRVSRRVNPFAMVPTQSSAAGVIALLSEPEAIIKQHALKSLIALVPQFWAEISEELELMYVATFASPNYRIDNLSSRENLEGNPDLPQDARHSAALLASKIYYYLEAYDEALTYALGAGPAFQAETRAPGSEEYVETIICARVIALEMRNFLTCFIAKAIDRYIEAQAKGANDVSPRLRDVMESIFKRCIEEGDYRQVCGLCIQRCKAFERVRISGHRNRP